MADGGQISLRMSLKGAEQVKAELASIGPAGSKMARELDRAMRTPGPGLKALDAGAREVRSSIDGLAGRAGSLGTGLSALGVVGLALAATLGAVVIAAVAVSSAMAEATQSAADLTDAADRIGIGTERLQEWRYAADEAGVGIADMESGLQKLNASLGAFKLGIGDGRLKPIFEELGITQEQLQGVENADQLMVMLADTLGQVEDRAAQVRLAKGLGIEELLPILRLGSDRLRELSDEAQNLGFVLDQDVAKRLDEADRSMERASQQMKILRDTAIAPLAEAFADATGYLAGLAVEFNGIESQAPRWIQVLNAIGRAMPWGGFQRMGEMAIARAAPNAGPPMAQNEATGETVTAADMRAFLSAPRGGFETRGHSSGRGGGGSRGPSKEQQEADRKRRDAEREIERIRVDELRASDDFQQYELRNGETPGLRAHAARLLAQSESDQEAWAAQQQRKTIEDAGLWNDEVARRLENIQGLRNGIRDAEERERVRGEELDLAEARLGAEQAYLQITSDILSIASADARTSAERREIELALLDIAQRRQRAELELAIAAETDAVKRQGLEAQLAYLPELHAAQTGAVLKRTAGPWESWRDGQRSAGEVSEFLEGRALDAMDGLNEGLRDAWSNAESAGDAFARMGQVGVDALEQIKDALLEVAIQRLLIQPMVEGLFGGAGGPSGLLGGLVGNLTGALMRGSGSVSSSANPTGGIVSSFYGPKGFAHGGVVGASGLYPIGERGLEMMQLPVGARIYDHDSTSRLISDMGRARTPFASAPSPVVNMPVTIINRSSSEVSATARPLPGGGMEVVLDDMIRNGIRKAGADGTLDRALRTTPQPIRR